MAMISKTFIADYKSGNFKKENVRFTVEHADGSFVRPTLLAKVVNLHEQKDLPLTLPDIPVRNIQFYWEEEVAPGIRIYRYHLIEGDTTSFWDIAAVQWDTVTMIENGKKTVYDGSWGIYGKAENILVGLANRKTESERIIAT